MRGFRRTQLTKKCEEFGIYKTNSGYYKKEEEDGYDFFVNVDNIHLLFELKHAKNIDTSTTQARYKFGLMLIGLALLNENNHQQKSNGSDEREEAFSKLLQGQRKPFHQ